MRPKYLLMSCEVIFIIFLWFGNCGYFFVRLFFFFFLHVVSPRFLHNCILSAKIKLYSVLEHKFEYKQGITKPKNGGRQIMASAKNRVVAGDLIGEQVFSSLLTGKDNVFVGNNRIVNRKYVEMYEVVTEDKVKSGTSAIFRGAVGAAVLGPVGLLAGLSARNKGIYSVAILWKDGKKSLIEIDDKLYKLIVKSMF